MFNSREWKLIIIRQDIGHLGSILLDNYDVVHLLLLKTRKYCSKRGVENLLTKLVINIINRFLAIVKEGYNI